MEIIMLVFPCLGLLFFLGMVGAIAFDKWEWVARFFFLTVLSEGATLVIAVVMMFLNLIF
uniref:Uncharacterized protein n=1 Tax=Siphoviridae sp. cttOT32 TaxID=2826493 RepID=A0A8S5QNV4_9CAUD|nr:MAG TPA: hypothetical protein [Siphoviridae sp. cttOT32]